MTLAPGNAAAALRAGAAAARLGQRPRLPSTDSGPFTERWSHPRRPQRRRQQPFLRGGIAARVGRGGADLAAGAVLGRVRCAGARRLCRGARGRFDRAVAQDPLVASLPPQPRRWRPACGTPRGATATRPGQLEAAVAAAPDAAEPRRLLALALEADDRHDDAVEQLQTPCGPTRRDERSRLALGRTLVGGGPAADGRTGLPRHPDALPRRRSRTSSSAACTSRSSGATRRAGAFAAAAAAAPILGGERLHELIGPARLADADFDGAHRRPSRRRVDASPNHAEAHRALGDTYLQLGRDDEALAELTAAALIDPADALAHAVRAQAAPAHRRYQAPPAAARAALARDARTTSARCTRSARRCCGSARPRKGQPRWRDSMRRQDAARARDERAWELRLLRQSAAMHAERGEFDEAVSALQDALALSRLRPTRASARAEEGRPHAGGARGARAGRGARRRPGVHVAAGRGAGRAGRTADSRRHLSLCGPREGRAISAPVPHGDRAAPPSGCSWRARARPPCRAQFAHGRAGAAGLARPSSRTWPRRSASCSSTSTAPSRPSTLPRR